MTGAVLDIVDVAYRWPGRAHFSLTVPALSVSEGETALLLGESGSAKSTLLSLICGTILPDRGRVAVMGADLAALSGSARDRMRAERIGVIFQQFNLLPFGSVMDNILLPLRFAPERKTTACWQCACRGGEAMCGAGPACGSSDCEGDGPECWSAAARRGRPCLDRAATFDYRG